MKKGDRIPSIALCFLNKPPHLEYVIEPRLSFCLLFFYRDCSLVVGVRGIVEALFFEIVHLGRIVKITIRPVFADLVPVACYQPVVKIGYDVVADIPRPVFFIGFFDCIL